MHYKVARNASGFNRPEVAAILRTCQFIFTSNIDMIHFIEGLYRNARTLLVRQDMSDETIKTILVACGYIEAEDSIETVSVLNAWCEAKDIKPYPPEKEAIHRAYWEAYARMHDMFVDDMHQHN
jgi:hypothetical protein